MQTNLMQCASYGLSTDRRIPHPFNICSNAGSTHTSISQTQPLDMTLSTCTQLLLPTMARPCGPVSKRRGSCSASASHSTCWHSWFPQWTSSPVPAALMQPQTMTLPPSCLTVGKTHLSLYSSPGCCHTCLTPSEPNKFILVSSDYRTWFQ